MGAVGAEGHLGFDAIVRWAPTFSFEIDLSAGISLYAFGMSFASVTCASTSRGRAPWVAHGTASVSLLFFDMDLEVGPITWGDGASPPPDARLARRHRGDALGKPASWRPSPPGQGDRVARLHHGHGARGRSRPPPRRLRGPPEPRAARDRDRQGRAAARVGGPGEPGRPDRRTVSRSPQCPRRPIGSLRRSSSSSPTTRSSPRRRSRTSRRGHAVLRRVRRQLRHRRSVAPTSGGRSAAGARPAPYSRRRSVQPAHPDQDPRGVACCPERRTLGAPYAVPPAPVASPTPARSCPVGAGPLAVAGVAAQR